MGRRLIALVGIIVLVLLAATLLWRVYVHHHEAQPFDQDALIETVRLDRSGSPVSIPSR